MIIALELPRQVDLSDFVEYLQQIGLPHRVNESGEKQLIWVFSEMEKARLLLAYEKYSRGEIQNEVLVPENSRPHRLPRFIREALTAPLTLTLIVANIICLPIALSASGDHFNAWFHAFTLLDFTVMGEQIRFANLSHTLASGEYWRLFTPMFLHFSWLHIVFNLLWVWEIGRRIEWVNGGSTLFVLTVISSVAANLTQYYLYGAGLFGGMSGVVYGLLGFCLVWQWLVPGRQHGLPRGIYVAMLGFLALGFTGAIDLLGLGNIANGAHLGGLVGGVLVALVVNVLVIFRRIVGHR